MPSLIVKIANRRKFKILYKVDEIKTQKMKIMHIKNGAYNF